MSIFDLPDVNDDDWNAYQADTFRRMTQPQSDALAFQQSIAPQVDDTFARIQRLAAPPPVVPQQPLPQMQTPMGGMFGGDGQSQGGLFGQQVDPAPLSTLLSQYPEEPGVQTSPPADGLGGFPSVSSPRPQQSVSEPIGPPGPPSPGLWEGIAPDKPNIFSWLGQQAQEGADQLRASGATQTPVVGGIMGGTAQAAANALTNLGGTSQALRQGNIPGAIGGVLQATVGENTPLAWGKDIATEAQAPTQIFPGISPETPVLGGLNNPRELAGLIPQLLVPETALERGIGRAAGRVLRPAAERVGEVVSPYVDNVLSSIGRGAEQQPAFGAVLGEDVRAFTGTRFPYEATDPSKLNPESLFGPGVYTTTDPRIAAEYAELPHDPRQFTTDQWREQIGYLARTAEDEGLADAARIVREVADQSAVDLTGKGGIEAIRGTRPLREASSDPVYTDIFTEWRDSLRHQGMNVRPTEVPSGTRLLEIDKPLPTDEWSMLRERLIREPSQQTPGRTLWDDVNSAVNQRRQQRIAQAGRGGDLPDSAMSNPDFIGHDYYRGIEDTLGGDKATVNRLLGESGFDGVAHQGGWNMPSFDDAGNPIRHQVYVIFPDKLGAVRNALTGQPGGIAMRGLESPFFSPARTSAQVVTDLALGAAGGVAGAATAPEDATWQERLERGAVGASLAAGIGPMARAPGGIGGLARNLLKDETGALNLGVLNPPEGFSDDEWRAMSRSARRRENYRLGRGEYARRSTQDVTGDYGVPESAPPHTSDAPDLAAQSAYDETAERMSARGVPEDEADETAYVVGREAAQDEAEKVSAEAPRLFDEQPELYPDEDVDAVVDHQAEIDRLTDGITPMLRQNPIVRGRQEAFIQQQEALPGMGGPELRASLSGGTDMPAYDADGNFVGFARTVGGRTQEEVMHAIADRTGSQPIGTQVARSLEAAGVDADTLFNPDEAVSGPLAKVPEGIALGEKMLAGETPEVRAYVQRVIAGLRGTFEMAHGRRSDAALREAVEAVTPYALDLARSADPATGMTSDVLVALMHKGVEATTTPTYIAYDRLQQLILDNAPEAAIAAARADYEARAAVNNIYLAGLEVYRSAAGRALRANRPDVYGSEPFFPEVAGGSGVDAGDPGRAKNFGKAEPAQEARTVAREEWATRQRALRRGEPVVDRGQDWNSAYWQRKRDLGQAANPGRSGRRINGPLENEGLLWTDLFVRDNPAAAKGTPLTHDERVRWLFGLAELGVEKGPSMDALYKRMAAIDPDNQDAVMKFWADAAREGGARDVSVLVERPHKRNPNRMVQVYEKVRQAESPWEDGIKEAGKLAERHNPPWMRAGKLDTTLPRDKALKVAYNAIKKRLDDATEALAEARRDGIAGDVKRYEQVILGAQKNMPADEGGTIKGLYERIKAEYPPDFEQTRMPGQRVAENVNVQSPEVLTKKVELLNQLDEMSRGIQAVRGGLSVVTSNMLMSSRMIEASAMEQAVTAINKVYTQAVWRGDMAGAQQILSGYTMGVVPAWTNMLYAFKHGLGPMEAMDYLNDIAAKGAPAVRSTPLSGTLTKGEVQAGWLAPMHRISRGMQEFFNTLIYYGELNRLAHVQVSDITAANAAARRLGAESRGRIFAGDATRIAPSRDPLTPGIWFKAPTEEMRAAALKEAMSIASGGPHSALAKTIGGLKANLEKSTTPGGKAVGLVANIIFPFVYGIDFTVRAGTKLATGPVVYPVKAATALARGDTTAARAYATNAGLTTAVNLFLVAQVLGGNLTGKGPSDPRERQALLEATDERGDPIWRPDAMRVPLPNGRHMWMAYGSLPIVGLTGAIFANAYDAYMYDGKSDDNIAATLAKAGAGVVGTVAEGTYFRDMMDLVSIFSEPQSADTAASRFAGGLVGRLIPAVVRQTAQAIDPNRKAPENALQEFAQNIPGVRNLVPNQVSPFTGGDVRMGWSPASLVSPGTVYYGSDGANPLAAETDRLNRLGFNANPSQYSATQQGHGTTVLGQRQTGEQIRAAQGIMADETQRRASALVNSPQYRAMSDADKAAALDAVYSRARSASDYDWQGQLTLTPQQQLARETTAIRRYIGPGLSGLSPSQLARRNEEIGQAKAMLTQFEQMYGPDRGEIMLRRVSREAWRDAVMYDDVDPDLRWLRERRAAQALGLDPRLAAQAGAANTTTAPLGAGLFGNTAGGTPNLIQPPDYSFANRFPPSARR